MLTLTRHVRKVLRDMGFTMVELMVTMAVMAVLAAIALPSFQVFMAENRASGKAMELVAAIKTAQTEALRRSRQVVFTLTNSPKPTAALTGAVDGKSWATVALPLQDAPSSETPEVISVGGYSEGTADVVVNTSTAATCFMPDGSIKANTATGISGADCDTVAVAGRQFLIRPSRGSKVWQVSVSPSGKIMRCQGTLDASGTFTCS